MSRKKAAFTTSSGYAKWMVTQTSHEEDSNMKLNFSKTSPFVRKVMVCAHEKGLADKIDLIDEYQDLSSTNPLSKIPALITDDGEAIYDSLVICVYLDGLSATPVLIPMDAKSRVSVLTSHALSNGVMDAAVAIVGENRRPEDKQWDDFKATQRGKIECALDALEKNSTSYANTIDLATISLGAMLGYLDLRHPELGWRERCSGLAGWYQGFSQRPSMQVTDPLT